MPKEKFYDGKILFETWCSWGKAATNPRLIEWAAKNMPNPNTGRSSQMGPYYAMWAWAFDNPEESYELWKKWRFDVNPAEVTSKEEYFIKLRDRALGNQNIAGRKKVERFCAKWGIPMKFRVEKDYVIQVTKSTHLLYQKYLTVNEVGDDCVIASICWQDGSITNHQLMMREFGVIGKAIV